MDLPRSSSTSVSPAVYTASGFPCGDGDDGDGDEGEHDGCGAGARPRSCADFLSNLVCARAVCAYLVPRRIVAVERTCREVQSGVEVGGVWSAQGPVQAQLLVSLDLELATYELPRISLSGAYSMIFRERLACRSFAEILKRMLREHDVRNILMLLSDIVPQGPELSRVLLSREHRWLRGLGSTAWLVSARTIWARLGDDGSCGFKNTSRNKICGGKGPKG